MPIIEVKMALGRTPEQKQELAAALTKETARILNLNPDWVTIVISEYSRDNWSTGGTLHSNKFGPGCGSEGTDRK